MSDENKRAALNRHSRIVTEGDERAPNRSMLRAVGFRDEDFGKPIIGVADARATNIYAAAYDRSTDTRSFYQFLKTMEIYETTVDAETSLILSTDGEFYRFLK